MTKMSEALDEFIESPGYKSYNDFFFAGYAAALAAVKEGGPHSWYLENEDEYMSEHLRKEHERLNSYTFKNCKVATPLYKLPEDV